MVPAPPWMTIPNFSDVFGVSSDSIIVDDVLSLSFLQLKRTKKIIKIVRNLFIY
jgi:hypothetical protein